MCLQMEERRAAFLSKNISLLFLEVGKQEEHSNEGNVCF